MTEIPKEKQSVDQRRKARMEWVDSMHPEMRRLVHDYGAHVVGAFIQCGITKPSRLRHLVETVLNELSPTRGTYSAQGTRSDANGYRSDENIT